MIKTLNEGEYGCFTSCDSTMQWLHHVY